MHGACRYTTLWLTLHPLHAKVADVSLKAVEASDNALLSLTAAPVAARLGALSDQVTATNILAFPGPDAARYSALVEQLKDEVQNLRVEIAALYSDRAKLAHLDNRVNDMELISWLL